MITLLLCLILIALVFGLALKITGAILKAVLWMCICLPIGILLWALAVVCCCTLLLIPVGIFLFKVGTHILIPV